MNKSHGTLEQRRAQARRWRQRHPETKRAENAVWRAKRGDHIREYNARYWRDHPDLRLVLRRRYRVRKIGANGSHTTQEWLDKCALLGNVCFYCGEAKPLTRDHKTPLVRGGTDNIDNILPACGSCNSRKSTKTVREFLALVA